MSKERLSPVSGARFPLFKISMVQKVDERVIGATPAGAPDRESAALAVREMFTSIAPRYDLLNHVLSCNIDRLWWWRTARRFDSILKRPDARVLDLCCGTGDMTFALRRRAGSEAPQILGADFSHAMLQRAAKKGTGTTLRWIEADALRLPFPDGNFHLVTSAFGFRNLADYDAGIARDRAGAGSGRRVRHFGFRRARWLTGKTLSCLLQESSSENWHYDFGSARSVRVFAGIGRALSSSGADAGTDAAGGISRSVVDSVFVWHCRVVSRSERLKELRQ
jgi:SAM-dependent methyltransferase